MNRIFKISAIVLLVAFGASCKKKVESPKQEARDQVFNSTLQNVRLGDGVPLNVKVAVRWKINDYETFSKQFESPAKYDSLILMPRQLELANNVGNRYPSIDSLFEKQRHAFKTNLKNYLLENLGEPGVEIKEVIISDLFFPHSYIESKEKMAMLEQKLVQIRKQQLIDAQNSLSAQERAKSDGQVQMAKAEAEAKIQKIKAETEKSVRASRLAKAETEKQVSKMRAQADAERKVLLAKADLEKRKDLQSLDMEKQRELDRIQLTKEQKREELKLANEMKMAKLCSENPVYANYIVNKELASKVQIAVLPSGQEASVFKGLLNNGLTAK